MREVAILNAALFWGTAAVVRNGRDVADDGDVEADGLNGTDGRFAAGARAFHADFDFLKAMTHSLAAGILGHHLRGISGAFARALEAAFAGARPADHMT